jgi:hypothetical protein
MMKFNGEKAEADHQVSSTTNLINGNIQSETIQMEDSTAKAPFKSLSQMGQQEPKQYQKQPQNRPNPLDDRRVNAVLPLIAPKTLIDEIPLQLESLDFVAQSRFNCEKIIQGKSDRLLVVIGPCSIHDPEAALEYGK